MRSVEKLQKLAFRLISVAKQIVMASSIYDAASECLNEIEQSNNPDKRALEFARSKQTELDELYAMLDWGYPQAAKIAKERLLKARSKAKLIPLDEIIESEGPESDYAGSRKLESIIDDIKSSKYKYMPPIDIELLDTIKKKSPKYYKSIRSKFGSKLEGKKYLLIDGHHRFFAHKQTKKPAIMAIITK